MRVGFEMFVSPYTATPATHEGFTDIEVKPTFEYWSLVTGRKP